MENLKIFDYNGTTITFDIDGRTMVNVTDFAKAFPDKNLSQIVNSNEIRDYVVKLAAIQNYIATDLLQVRNGIGTWAESKVALRIAQKLSTEFAIWVGIKLEELLTTGKVELRPKSQIEILLESVPTSLSNGKEANCT